MNTLEAIHKRRSIRAYTGELIPKDDLLKIVEAGRWAPSGYNRQPWELIIVTDREMINKLKVASQWMENAAAIICIVLDPSESKFWLEDGSAMIQNILLAATDLGYGSCWLQGYTERSEEKLKKLLHVPTEKRLLTLIPIGVAVEWAKGEKKPLKDILYWEKFGTK